MTAVMSWSPDRVTLNENRDYDLMFTRLTRGYEENIMSCTVGGDLTRLDLFMHNKTIIHWGDPFLFFYFDVTGLTGSAISSEPASNDDHLPHFSLSARRLICDEFTTFQFFQHFLRLISGGYLIFLLICL